VGLGFSYERHKFSGWDYRAGSAPQPVQAIREDVTFLWSLGGGVEAMINPWLSIGISLRVGMIHGARTDSDDPERQEDSSNAPYGTLAASVSFHL
jgi:hypothetical protein